MTEESTLNRRRRLLELYREAIDEMIAAIKAKLADGKRPEQSRMPQLSVRDNGLPSISDPPLFSGNGPVDYAKLLEPPYGDEAARQRGRYPVEDFPRLQALIDYVKTNGGVAHAYPVNEHHMVVEIQIRFQIESAVNLHMLKHGPEEWAAASEKAILLPLLRGLFDDRLDLAIVVPIALTNFAFDRARIAPDMLVVRMSPGLQRARWTGKAFGTSGHDVVLASATHALVLTGWGIDNGRHWDLHQRLRQIGSQARELIDTAFATLRLETGIATGYAQLMWLARHWRMSHHFADPEIHADGARRYPEAFDDFGWLREDIPVVTRAEISNVASSLAAIRQTSEPRLALALRRLNAAMTRDEHADAILDATIALELLLGDKDNQAISWKLKMRAAALAGLSGGRQEMEDASRAVGEVYALRSAIVHGAPRKRRKASVSDPETGKRLAIETLRSVLRAIIAAPRFLDPLRIDHELMMVPSNKPTPIGELPNKKDP